MLEYDVAATTETDNRIYIIRHLWFRIYFGLGIFYCYEKFILLLEFNQLLKDLVIVFSHLDFAD